MYIVYTRTAIYAGLAHAEYVALRDTLALYGEAVEEVVKDGHSFGAHG